MAIHIWFGAWQREITHRNGLTKRMHKSEDITRNVIQENAVFVTLALSPTCKSTPKYLGTKRYEK
jgi:hypothetical protein